MLFGVPEIAYGVGGAGVLSDVVSGGVGSNEHEELSLDVSVYALWMLQDDLADQGVKNLCLVEGEATTIVACPERGAYIVVKPG